MNERVFTSRHADALARFHAETDDFGHVGHLWAPHVLSFMKEHGCESLLDYGAGKGTMGAHCRARAGASGFPLLMQEYDPATFPGVPRPADMVSCIDVLEHVEEELLDNVLRDLRRCMGRVALITVSLRYGSRANRHIHQLAGRPRDFWHAKIQLEVGNVTEIATLDPTKAKSEFACIVRPHDQFPIT